MGVDNIKSIIPIDKVYEDALSPAMKQIGKSLEGVAKTSRFLLAPFDYLLLSTTDGKGICTK